MAWLIGKYAILFVVSALKFLVAPISGWTTGLSFIEIFIVHSFAGWCSFMIFFYGASFFVKRHERKQAEKRIRALARGESYTVRKFTWINRLSVRVKRLKYGYLAMFALTASFISIPIGAIIMARFYAHRKKVWLHAIPVIIAPSFILTWVWSFSAIQ